MANRSGGKNPGGSPKQLEPRQLNGFNLFQTGKIDQEVLAMSVEMNFFKGFAKMLAESLCQTAFWLPGVSLD